MAHPMSPMTAIRRKNEEIGARASGRNALTASNRYNHGNARKPKEFCCWIEKNSQDKNLDKGDFGFYFRMPYGLCYGGQGHTE